MFLTNSISITGVGADTQARSFEARIFKAHENVYVLGVVDDFETDPLTAIVAAGVFSSEDSANRGIEKILASLHGAIGLESTDSNEALDYAFVVHGKPIDFELLLDAADSQSRLAFGNEKFGGRAQIPALRQTYALAHALDSFWASVAAAYPEIKTGDLEPAVVMRLESEAERAIEAWVRSNEAPGDTQKNDGPSLG